MEQAKGWKTRTAAYLGGACAVIGMGIYFIGGPDAPFAMSPVEGLPLALGAFGLFGVRDALGKVLSKG